MPYQSLLFDADDTLFSYEHAEETSLKATFEHFNLPFNAQASQTYQKVNAGLWKLFEQGKIVLDELRVRRFADLFTILDQSIDAESFSEYYVFQLGQSTELVPHAFETLQELQGNYRMAVITNGISTVQRSRFALSPIGQFFENLFISEEIGISKPANGFFDAVFDGISQPNKNQVLVIGDSLSSDMRGGYNYGLDTCWFNPNRKSNESGIVVTYEINDLRELPELIKNH